VNIVGAPNAIQNVGLARASVHVKNVKCASVASRARLAMSVQDNLDAAARNVRAAGKHAIDGTAHKSAELRDSIKHSAEHGYDAVKDTLDDGLSGAKGASSKIAHGVEGGADRVKHAATAAADELRGKSNLERAGDNLRRAEHDAVRDIKQKGAEGRDYVEHGSTDNYNTVKEKVSDGVSAVKHAGSNIANSVKDGARRVKHAANDAADDVRGK